MFEFALESRKDLAEDRHSILDSEVIQTGKKLQESGPSIGWETAQITNSLT